MVKNDGAIMPVVNVWNFYVYGILGYMTDLLRSCFVILYILCNFNVTTNVSNL